MRRLGHNSTSTVVTFIPPGFHLFLFHPSTHIAPRLNKLTVPSPSPIFTPLRTYSAWEMSRLPNTTGPDDLRYLGICCMIRILVVNTTGFVQRQVQRRPSGFAFWILLVRQSIFVFILAARVPTGGGQETTHCGIRSQPYQYER